MRNVRPERGQALVITIASLVAMLGMAALVLDVGAWFHQKRELQATADAAALAGAQLLPDNPGGAKAQALTYAGKNGGGVKAADVVVSSGPMSNDTISVKAQKDNAGFFSHVAGVLSVNIGASAKARVAVPVQAKGVAPIVVKNTHPLVQGSASCPCFNQLTTIPLDKAGAPGAFDLLNLDNTKGGTSPGRLGDWILNGYDGYLGLGDYYSDPGAKFNSSQIKSALDQRIGSVLLFPVYDVLTGNGANAKYHVIGWIGFHLNSYDIKGRGSIAGYFTEYIAQGIQPTNGQAGPPWFGVVSVQLIG
jgi:Flp pilus assembly protein TadG